MKRDISLDLSEDKRVKISELEVCEHCLRRYLKGHIEERRLQLRCPLHGDHGCAAEVDLEDLKGVLPEATLQKYHRGSEKTKKTFKKMIENDSKSIYVNQKLKQIKLNQDLKIEQFRQKMNLKMNFKVKFLSSCEASRRWRRSPR